MTQIQSHQTTSPRMLKVLAGEIQVGPPPAETMGPHLPSHLLAGVYPVTQPQPAAAVPADFNPLAGLEA